MKGNRALVVLLVIFSFVLCEQAEARFLGRILAAPFIGAARVIGGAARIAGAVAVGAVRVATFPIRAALGFPFRHHGGPVFVGGPGGGGPVMMNGGGGPIMMGGGGPIMSGGGGGCGGGMGGGHGMGGHGGSDVDDINGLGAGGNIAGIDDGTGAIDAGVGGNLGEPGGPDSLAGSGTGSVAGRGVGGSSTDGATGGVAGTHAPGGSLLSQIPRGVGTRSRNERLVRSGTNGLLGFQTTFLKGGGSGNGCSSTLFAVENLGASGGADSLTGTGFEPPAGQTGDSGGCVQFQLSANHCHEDIPGLPGTQRVQNIGGFQVSSKNIVQETPAGRQVVRAFSPRGTDATVLVSRCNGLEKQAQIVPPADGPARPGERVAYCKVMGGRAGLFGGLAAASRFVGRLAGSILLRTNPSFQTQQGDSGGCLVRRTAEGWRLVGALHGGTQNNGEKVSIYQQSRVPDFMRAIQRAVAGRDNSQLVAGSTRQNRLVTQQLPSGSGAI